MKCPKCKKKMDEIEWKWHPRPMALFCFNKKCEWYGIERVHKENIGAIIER